MRACDSPGCYHRAVDDVYFSEESGEWFTARLTADGIDRCDLHYRAAVLRVVVDTESFYGLTPLSHPSGGHVFTPAMRNMRKLRALRLTQPEP